MHDDLISEYAAPKASCRNRTDKMHRTGRLTGLSVTEVRAMADWTIHMHEIDVAKQKIRILRLTLEVRETNPCRPSLLTTHSQPLVLSLAFSLRFDAGHPCATPTQYCKRRHLFPLQKLLISSSVTISTLPCHLDLIVQQPLTDITFVNPSHSSASGPF